MSDGPPKNTLAYSVSELQRRREVLKTTAVPVHICWGSNVPDHEAAVALDGVRQGLEATGQSRRIVVAGSKAVTSGPFGSPDWYVNTAYSQQNFRRETANYGSQIDVGELMHLFYVEPWQDPKLSGPHLNIMLINYDLTDYPDRPGPFWKILPPNHELLQGQADQPLNFVYGSTYQDFATIQSVTRLTHSVESGKLRDEMLRRLMRHEIGHLFGIPSRNYRVEENLGTHCANVCTMRQGINMQEWASKTYEEMQTGTHFCHDCLHDFSARKSAYKPMP